MDVPQDAGHASAGALPSCMPPLPAAPFPSGVDMANPQTVYSFMSALQWWQTMGGSWLNGTPGIPFTLKCFGRTSLTAAEAQWLLQFLSDSSQPFLRLLSQAWVEPRPLHLLVHSAWQSSGVLPPSPFITCEQMLLQSDVLQ